MKVREIAFLFCIVWAVPLASGVAQTGSNMQSHWFAISGGLGIAGGSRYATVSERVAQAELVVPVHGHRLEASAVGAWSETTIGCYASPCDVKPELVGGALSALKGIAWWRGRELAVASLGVGAYRLPGGASADEVHAGLYPALQAGVEAAFPVAANTAIAVSTRAVVLPRVYGDQVVFAQFGVGLRVW
jgi:hypothetical protein